MKYEIGDAVRYAFNGIENFDTIFSSSVVNIGGGLNAFQYRMKNSHHIILESLILGYAPPKDPSGTQKTKTKPIDNDPVNNPPHHTKGAVECIDAMQSALSHEQFVGFLKGQIIEYTWRCNHKANSIQGIEKAIWYAKKLVEVLKSSV